MNMIVNFNQQNVEIIKQQEWERKPIFSCSTIPEEIQKDMKGKSLPENAQIDTEDLAYVTVSYYGFDEKLHQGEIVVHQKLGEEVVEIFRELYEKKYPIEKVERIDQYDANDVKSMEANNSSGFCYRLVEGTNRLSNHAKGCAIDINPLQNPQIKNGIVYPSVSEKFANRENREKGMIEKGDAVYQAFIKRGWKWGGEWKNPDYQHFEKEI